MDVVSTTVPVAQATQAVVASQLVETGDWFREFLRTSAEEAGRAAGVRYAESFRRLDLGG